MTDTLHRTAPPALMAPGMLDSLTLRDVAAWAYRLRFVRCRYAADAVGRRWHFASRNARGSITVTHQPHLPHPWTVELTAGLERVELVTITPERLLVAAHLIGVGTAPGGRS